MKFLLLLVCFFSFKAHGESKTCDPSEALILHVQESIENAKRGLSNLTPSILNLAGMSNPPVRHLLNNLCSYPGTCYLEIGLWKGSTWISALYENQNAIYQATGIDDWSEFSGPRMEFDENCYQFLQNLTYKVYSQNCFKINLKEPFDYPVTTYFYDGNHTSEAQELAFTYFDPVFDDVFIAVIDDWKFSKVQEGTRAAFKKLNYEILFETELPAKRVALDPVGFNNGLYIAVLRKPVK
jgi:hypothetical protein